MITNQVAIALGSNLGASLTILENALELLNNHPQIQVIKKSSWYQTAPIGPPQPDYINGCALLSVKMTAVELLTTLLEIERQFGRIRQEKWGARTLDLDILLFDQLIISSPELTIPHPQMTARAFVLVPLAEIAPDLVHPVTQKTIQEHLKQIKYTGVRLI